MARRPSGIAVVDPDQQPRTSKVDVGSSAVPRKAQLTRSPEAEWPQESLPAPNNGSCGLYW